MKPAKYIKAITSQVEILEDFKCQLECLLEDVKKVIMKGKLWIEDKETKFSFFEINHFMINETSQCMKKCLNIANDNQESEYLNNSLEQAVVVNDLTQHPTFSISMTKDDTRYNELREKMEEMDIRHSKKINSMKLILRSLEKHNEITENEKEKKDKTIDTKISEIMNELHSASYFMSLLQSKSENEVKQLEESNTNILKRIDEHEEKIESIVRKQSDTYDKLNDNTVAISEFCSETASKVDLISPRITELENLSLKSLVSMVKLLRNDVDILNINAAASKESTQMIATKHAKAIVEVQKRVTTIDTQMKEVLRHLEELSGNQNVQNTLVGFKAQFSEKMVQDFRQEEIIKCFDDVEIDLQKNFDTKTGIFTAPVNGLYLCSLTIDPMKNLHDIWEFEVTHEDKYINVENVIIKVHVNKHDSMASAVGLVEMSKDDQLYVQAADDMNGVKLSNYSQVMCVLIKEFI